MANYIFVARADGVFEIGEIEVGPCWVVGVVFVVGDHDDDDDARSGEVFVGSFQSGSGGGLFLFSFFQGASAE